MIKTALGMFRFNWYAMPVLIVGLLMLLIGIFILLQNKRSRVNFSFFLIGVCGFLWFLGIAGTYAASTPEIALAIYRNVTFLGVALIAPCTHYFSATWLEDCDGRDQERNEKDAHRDTGRRVRE